MRKAVLKNMAVDLRVMTLDDIDFGMTLKDKANWNQTPADWRRFIELQPDGCFVASLDGRQVGCGSTCILGDSGWIAMILVDPEARGQGVGTAIMRGALDFLAQKQVPTPRLDATPMGQPLYEKLGFHAEYKVARLGGCLKAGQEAPDVRKPTPDDLEAIVALDRFATGTDRSRLLARLLDEFPDTSLVAEREDGALDGFVFWRPGTKAWQIGPCIASSDEAGTKMFNEVFRRHAGESVFMDVPYDNAPAMRMARKHGLEPLRDFMRMYKGTPITDRPQAIWASSGPEKG